MCMIITYEYDYNLYHEIYINCYVLSMKEHTHAHRHKQTTSLFLSNEINMI